MKEIPLTQGKVALVDDEDYERVSKYKWYAHKESYTYYAVRNLYDSGTRITIRMHRFILNLSNENMSIDHKDRDGLNNQRINLRICIKSQNNMNRGKIVGLIKYKGVSKYKVKHKNKTYIYYWKNKHPKYNKKIF